MVELIKQVNALAEKEYERASEKFGSKNNSSHESYSVLKEELEESREECIAAEVFMDKYWKAVRENDRELQRKMLEGIYEKSLYAACEFIQTAAMAHKALKTLSGGD